VKKHLFLSVICFLLLVLLVAVPALAATVTCPSSCSCLLPAEAKNLGYSGYCSDKQQVCGLRPAEEREVLLHKTGDDNDHTGADRHRTPIRHDNSNNHPGPHNLPVGLFLLHA
jgi:hypothetical protein